MCDAHPANKREMLSFVEPHNKEHPFPLFSLDDMVASVFHHRDSLAASPREHPPVPPASPLAAATAESTISAPAATPVSLKRGRNDDEKLEPYSGALGTSPSSTALLSPTRGGRQAVVMRQRANTLCFGSFTSSSREPIARPLMSIALGSPPTERASHVKRPMNAFMVWAQERRREVKLSNPTLHNATISRSLGEEWNALPEADKQPFVERARALKMEHQQEHPDYKYNPRRKPRHDGPSLLPSALTAERARHSPAAAAAAVAAATTAAPGVAAHPHKAPSTPRRRAASHPAMPASRAEPVGQQRNPLQTASSSLLTDFSAAGPASCASENGNGSEHGYPCAVPTQMCTSALPAFESFLFGMDAAPGQQGCADMLFEHSQHITRSLSDSAADARVQSYSPSTFTAFSECYEPAPGGLQPPSVHVCLGVPASMWASGKDESAATELSFFAPENASHGSGDSVFAHVPPSTPSRQHTRRTVAPRTHAHTPAHRHAEPHHACERDTACHPQPSPSRCLEPQLAQSIKRVPQDPASNLFSYRATAASGHCMHAATTASASYVAEGDDVWDTVEVLTSGAACAALTQDTHTSSAQDVDGGMVDWASIERMLELWPL